MMVAAGYVTLNEEVSFICQNHPGNDLLCRPQSQRIIEDGIKDRKEAGAVTDRYP